MVLGGDTLSAVGSGLTLPFFLVYLTRVRGIDVTVAGFALSTVALTGFVGNPVGGWLTDRIGARRALVCGLLVAGAGAFLVTLIREPWHAFTAASVVGFGAAVIWPAQDALLAVVVAPEQRSSVFAMRNATLNAGFGLGALVASLIADLSSPASFVTLYVIDGLSYLAFVPILVVLLPSSGERQVEPAGSTAADVPASYRTVLRDRTFLRFWALIALLVAIGFAQTHAGFPAYATRDGGIGAGGLSVAFAANTLTVVAAQLLVLRAMEGRRRTTAIALACLLWGTAWAMTIFAGGLGSGPVAVLTFAAALAVFGLGETFLAPSQAAMANDLAPDKLRGRYNGLYTMAWTTGFTIGPIVAGVALGAGNGTALFVGLIVACGVAALAATRLAHHLPASVNVIGAHQAIDDTSSA